MTQSTRALAAQELQLFKAAFFKALAHPIRIRILERLVGQDHTVQELQEALQLSQPVVSQRWRSGVPTTWCPARNRGRRSATRCAIRSLGICSTSRGASSTTTWSARKAC